MNRDGSLFLEKEKINFEKTKMTTSWCNVVNNDKKNELFKVDYS
mgnify:CR=1 FL=1